MHKKIKSLLLLLSLSCIVSCNQSSESNSLKESQSLNLTSSLELETSSNLESNSNSSNLISSLASENISSNSVNPSSSIETSYNVSYIDLPSGIIMHLNGISFKKGEIVKFGLEIKEYSKYRIDRVGVDSNTLVGEPDKENIHLINYQFVQPDHDVMIEIDYKELFGVSLSTKITSALNITGIEDSFYAKGDKITFVVEAKNGYYFENLCLTCSNGEVVFTKNEDGSYSFIMPNCDVEIDAEVGKTSNVVHIINNDGSYILQTIYEEDLVELYDGTHFSIGENVRFKVALNDEINYIVEEVKVNENVLTKDSEGFYSFVMPNHDVNISVKTKINYRQIEVIDSLHFSVNVSKKINGTFVNIDKVTYENCALDEFRFEVCIKDGFQINDYTILSSAEAFKIYYVSDENNMIELLTQVEYIDELSTSTNKIFKWIVPADSNTSYRIELQEGNLGLGSSFDKAIEINFEGNSYNGTFNTNKFASKMYYKFSTSVSDYYYLLATTSGYYSFNMYKSDCITKVNVTGSINDSSGLKFEALENEIYYLEIGFNEENVFGEGAFVINTIEGDYITDIEDVNLNIEKEIHSQNEKWFKFVAPETKTYRISKNVYNGISGTLRFYYDLSQNTPSFEFFGVYSAVKIVDLNQGDVLYIKSISNDTFSDSEYYALLISDQEIVNATIDNAEMMNVDEIKSSLFIVGESRYYKINLEKNDYNINLSANGVFNINIYDLNNQLVFSKSKIRSVNEYISFETGTYIIELNSTSTYNDNGINVELLFKFPPEGMFESNPIMTIENSLIEVDYSNAKRSEEKATYGSGNFYYNTINYAYIANSTCEGMISYTNAGGSYSTYCFVTIIDQTDNIVIHSPTSQGSSNKEMNMSFISGHKYLIKIKTRSSNSYSKPDSKTTFIITTN